MPQGYGFLKYGRPMAAAAPLLLALSAMPSTTHACTGNANDPVFCSQVNGQFVTGVGAFIDNNLSGVPGTSPIPGSTAPLDDDFDSGDFLSPIDDPIDDDNDLDSPFIGTGEFSETGFVRTITVPPAITGDDVTRAIQNALRNPDVWAIELFERTNRPNVSDTRGSALYTLPLRGLPQITNPGTSAPAKGAAYPFYSSPTIGYQPDRFQIVVVPDTNNVAVFAPDGTLPQSVQRLVDQSAGTDSSGSSGCSISTPACQAQVGEFFISVSNVIPSENVAPVLNVLVNGPLTVAPLDGGENALVGLDGNPEDTAGLRSHYRIDLPDSPGTSGSSGSSDDAAGDAFVARQVASITKLRDEVANAPDPETRRQKQAELQRKESAIQQYGSAAVRHALGLGDARSAPVPGRN